MFPVVRMCQVLNVSPSGYYAWRERPVSKREMANQELVEKIKEIHIENREGLWQSAPLQSALGTGMEV